MKVLLFNHPFISEHLDPAAFQVDMLELRVAESFENGLQALRTDQFDGVVIDAVSLEDPAGQFKETFQTTQSPTCHLILGMSQDDEISVEALDHGVDGCIEFPLHKAALQNLMHARQRRDADILKQRTELRTRDEEIATLVAISNIVTSNLEFIPSLAAIAQETSKALDADRTTIFLYQSDREELEAAYAEGLGPYSISLPATQGIAGHVVVTREMLNIVDAYQSPFFHDKIDQETGYTTRTVLCVPLISPTGDLIGVAECLNKRQGTFTETDEHILNMLSPLFAVAIENALLYRDLQAQVHHNEQMTAEKIQSERLAVVGRMAGAVTKDIADPMKEIVEHAAHLGRENLAPEERDVTCQAIERIVDHLVDMAQELLDFSRGSLELEKINVTIDELTSRVQSLLGHTAGGRDLTIDTRMGGSTSIMIDLDKFARALSRVMLALHQLMNAPLSLVVEPDDDGMTLTIAPLSDPAITTFMGMLDRPFSDADIGHDMGLKIAVAQRVISTHGGTFAQQSDGLSIRAPAILSTGG